MCGILSNHPFSLLLGYASQREVGREELWYTNREYCWEVFEPRKAWRPWETILDKQLCYGTLA